MVFAEYFLWLWYRLGFLRGSVVKNLPASAGRSRRQGFNPWFGKIPWRSNSNPVQYSCLKNPMDRGAW